MRGQFLHFDVISFVGQGSFGSVWYARNSRDGREVALKLVEKGEGEDQQLKYEAEVAGARLQMDVMDPGGCLVKVYDFGADQQSGTFYIEMEYIDGENLSALIKRRVSASEAARIAISLCELLEWLGSRSVLHGDIKPSNVRIQSGSGKVRVLDFGIARALDRTKVTVKFNSPVYTSPERLSSGKADLHSDLWSVGVILYELVAGKNPFQDENYELMRDRIMQRPLPPLPENSPAGLRRIVMRMLARNPAQRFANPAGANAALRAFLEDPTAVSSGGGDETVYVPPPQGEETKRAPAPAPRKRDPLLPPRVRYSLVSVSVLLFLMLTVTAFRTYSAGRALGQEIDKEHFKDADEAWKTYEALKEGKMLPSLLFPARSSLKKALVDAAFDYIDEYRTSENPSVAEAQWRRGLTHLSRALDLDAADAKVRAAMRLCEGHLARIQSTSAAARKDSALKQRYSNAASQKFLDAAAMDPKWPDPYIGLARLYSYDAPDLDQAIEALDKARQRGFALRKREKAQLADGYFRRIDQYLAISRTLKEMPEQEQRQLEKAQSDCREGARLYDDVGMWGSAVENHGRLSKLCQSVATRLEELQRPVTAPVAQ
jgi:predicted Ser/Thr protein kinase